MKRIISVTLAICVGMGLLISCSASATPTPTSTPTITPTPIPWQAPDQWWTKLQVPAFSKELFVQYANDPGYRLVPPEYYLDFYAQAGVTLASWNDIRAFENWRTVYPGIVAELHDRHIIVVGGISGVTVMLPGETPEEALVRDPYGNTVQNNWGTAAQPNMVDVLSVLHPAYQNYMLSVVKTYIDAGVDGILVDELVDGSVFLPDFNENTVLEFRQYLLDTYTSEELAALGQRYGVSDFSTLDYSALVRASLPGDRTSLSKQDWQGELSSRIPLYTDYQRFVRIKNREYALWLVSEGKKYALEQYGREISFSANLNTIEQNVLYMIDILDYADMEYFYKSQGYFPAARASIVAHLAYAFDKPVYLLTAYGDTDADIADRGTEKSTNLFRLMIAEAYSNGAGFQVEEDLHGIKQDINALAPYYRFPRDYPYLFETTPLNEGQIGLLHLWEARDVWNYTDLRGLDQMLADSGYQFKIIFGAEEFTTPDGSNYMVPAPDHPLTLDALSSFKLVILPQFDDITPNHADILLKYVKQGGKILVFSTPEMLGRINWERGQSSPAVRELLDAINAGKAEVGDGRIIAIKELWGKPYATEPQPVMRQPMLDLLVAENIQPEVNMSAVNFVGTFIHKSTDSLTVHFVNYDYDPDTDTTTPAGPLQVEITLPDGLISDTPAIYLYSPDSPMRVLSGEMSGNKLSLTLPEFDIWNVLWIGDENSLQTGIAAYPTSTPLPAATATPSIEPGFVVYDDSLATGWKSVTDNATKDLSSTTFIHQGTRAIEVNAEKFGALKLEYQQSIDTTGYDYLVLYVNPAGTENLNFSVTIFNQGKPMTYVFMSGYLGSKPLLPNEWRRIVIPLSDLNPEGAVFDSLYIQNEGKGEATFYLDDIFFAADQ